MKTKYFAVFSFLFFIVSFIITTPSLFGQESRVVCYICMDSECLQTYGSGWTGCVQGLNYCGFYGSPCTSN